MHKMKNKIYSSIFVILLLTSFVLAIGGGSVYSKSNPFEAYKGETKIAMISLQNTVGTEDVTFKADITKGSEIASFDQDTFLVAAGTEVWAELEVKIPSDYEKTLTEVEINFNTVASRDAAGVELGFGFLETFDVKVSEPPEKQFPMGIVLTIVIILIIILVVIIYLVNKKKKTTNLK